MSESAPKAAPTFFAAALPPKPEGEDFFLVAVEIDTAEDALCNDGFNIIGTWEQVDQTFSRYMTGGGIRRKHTVSIYQGDAAREKLLEGIKEEARYQAQRHAQPNN